MIDRPDWFDGASLPAVVDAPPAAPVSAPSGAREGASVLWNNWDGIEAPEPQTYRGDIVLENVGNREEFLAGFEALPDAARVAIFEELDLSPDVRVTPASDADVKRFATTPEGAELVAAWGKDAARNVGLVRTRIERALSLMTPEDMDKAMDWFEALPSHQAKAILWGLAYA